MGQIVGNEERTSYAASMKVVWSNEALFDIADLRDYIAGDDPKAASRVLLAIVQTIEKTLAENPHIGRPGRAPDTRELVIPRTPFVIPYRIRGTVLQILRVYHEARRWPDHF